MYRAIHSIARVEAQTHFCPYHAPKIPDRAIERSDGNVHSFALNASDLRSNLTAIQSRAGVSLEAGSETVLYDRV